MPHLTFREKIVVLSLVLVALVQLGSFTFVLDALKTDSDLQADRTVTRGGVILDEFMENRNEQLLTTANVLVADYAFRDAVALGDEKTIESVLKNHAARANADIAMLLDLDGNVIASSADDTAAGEHLAQGQAAGSTGAEPSVTYVGSKAYQTVTVVVRSPLPTAQVVLGFEIDDALASRIEALTGLRVTFLNIDRGVPRPVASTLTGRDRQTALASMAPTGLITIDPRSNARVAEGAQYLSLLRSFLAGTPDLFVTLQLSLSDAMASYIGIRYILYLITAISLVIACASAFWVAGMVTRPVDRLAAAARRMREGIYTEIVEVTSKDELGELAAGFNAMQDAIAEREHHIYHVAHHDSLSGLPNRDLVIGELRGLLEDNRRVDVISVSIDRMSRIVASMGHRAGDELIRLVAGVLRQLTGPDQFLGHINGSEFIVLMSEPRPDDADRLIDRIAQALHAGVRVDGANFSLQITAGIATYPDHADNAAGLLHRAGIARAEAELAHESLVVYSAGQEARAVRRMRMIGDFPAAVANNELVAFYQPKVDCRTRAVFGAEALARWQHPELGELSPYEFIDAIEQSGGITHLTRWMMRSAVAQCRAWRNVGINVGVAVNISVDDLANENLPYFLLDLVRNEGIKPWDITLEVTESAIMRNLFKAVSVITCIHELGFRLAIDDFGTGQSSLAQLRRLPVDELKIDKSFIMNMADSKDEAIVRATIELAECLGLTVCAEGIEQLEILDKLHRMGAQYGQGFAIARPLPSAEFAAWYEQWQAACRADEPESAPRAVV